MYVIEATVVSKFGSTRQLFFTLVGVCFIMLYSNFCSIIKFVCFDQVDTCYPILWMLYYFFILLDLYFIITNLYALN